MVVGVIITQVVLSWSSLYDKLALVTPVLQPIKPHIYGFRPFLLNGFIGESHCCGIIHLDQCRGWGCPISTKHILIEMFACAVVKPAPISDCAADPITNFIIVAITYMCPLMEQYVGDFPGAGLLLRKKWLHVLLCALITDKKDASLCAYRHMSLATCVISASRCVAQ